MDVALGYILLPGAKAIAVRWRFNWIFGGSLIGYFSILIGNERTLIRYLKSMQKRREGFSGKNCFWEASVNQICICGL